MLLWDYYCYCCWFSLFSPSHMQGVLYFLIIYIQLCFNKLFCYRRRNNVPLLPITQAPSENRYVYIFFLITWKKLKNFELCFQIDWFFFIAATDRKREECAGFYVLLYVVTDLKNLPHTSFIFK